MYAFHLQQHSVFQDQACYEIELKLLAGHQLNFSVFPQDLLMHSGKNVLGVTEHFIFYCLKHNLTLLK